ncbi:MAG: hypothetical protein IJO08_04955 [Clostridia bacterium]|nr:hypothetical protein [Clostridia bacterium]
MANNTRGIPTINEEAEARRNHEFLSQFFGGQEESDVCLGDKCIHKACEICPANRSRLMPTDAYRQSVKTGYYTSGTCKKIDSRTGKETYFYAKPGE